MRRKGDRSSDAPDDSDYMARGTGAVSGCANAAKSTTLHPYRYTLAGHRLDNVLPSASIRGSTTRPVLEAPNKDLRCLMRHACSLTRETFWSVFSPPVQTFDVIFVSTISCGESYWQLSSLVHLYIDKDRFFKQYWKDEIE